MEIFVEKIENPNNEFWIWDKKITNKQAGGIYPSTTSNVGSGITVAIYQVDESEAFVQIAQLEVPDYEKLTEYYLSGHEINLDYTYIDDFAWLGDKKRYEVDEFSYTEYESFSARCSFFNSLGEKTYKHIVQLKVLQGDIDFSYAAFCNLDLFFYNIIVEQGNLKFDYARFYNTNISLMSIMCGGALLFSPEISFCYIMADNSVIDTMLMSQKLSLKFLCAKTTNTTISLDPLPAEFNDICFTKAVVDKITITNANVNSLDILEAHIKYLEFKECNFIGLSKINGNITELHIDDCVNSNVFQLFLPQTKKLSFSHTINNGRFCFVDFNDNIKAISESFDSSTCDTEQLLMLKENFRQTGEFENEDTCHLLYQRLRTKKEKNLFKKIGRCFLDGISGYGTKPLRMLFVILITIVLFGTVYYFTPTLSFHGVNTWLENIYASGITFFAVGYGDLFPANLVTKMVSLAEAFLGVTCTSYFLVLLTRKIIR